MQEIPLFPLPLVLFPGGNLELQIFEIRYLDMVKHCMRGDTGFGIIMIEEGEQVLQENVHSLPAVSHYGTYCRIIDFDQRPNGLLGIRVQGERKFVVQDQFEGQNRLMMAKVQFLEEEGNAPLPEQHEHLASLLDTLIEHEAVRKSGLQIDYGDALEVGARLTELLPCANSQKQRLLEMRDPIARLTELEKLIEQLQRTRA